MNGVNHKEEPDALVKIPLNTAGFSLIELMMAMTILGFVGLGITQNLILTRGMAETSVREVTAHAVASGYIEQLKSMEYERIVVSVLDPDTPIPTILSRGEPDELYLGETNYKDVVIDEDAESGSFRTMRMQVELDIENLHNPAAGKHDRILSIELRYTYENAKTRDRQSRTLRTMRSYVPTF